VESHGVLVRARLASPFPEQGSETPPAGRNVEPFGGTPIILCPISHVSLRILMRYYVPSLNLVACWLLAALASAGVAPHPRLSSAEHAWRCFATIWHMKALCRACCFVFENPHDIGNVSHAISAWAIWYVTFLFFFFSFCLCSRF
jgi:hypothetical protein